MISGLSSKKMSSCKWPILCNLLFFPYFGVSNTPYLGSDGLAFTPCGSRPSPVCNCSLWAMDREEKSLCHVAMVTKSLHVQTKNVT